MTVRELGVLWMQRRREESQEPEEGQARGRQGGPVSPQTLAGYQAALTHLVNPRLGNLRLHEVTVGYLDSVLRSVEREGRTTSHARTALGMMFSLAVRHRAMQANPLREVERPRRRKGNVHALNVERAKALLAAIAAWDAGHTVDKQGRPTGGKRRSPDLHELVLFMLATSTRIGEALAVTWADVDLSADPATVHIGATLVEPRKDKATGQVFVAGLRRQPLTKGGRSRTLVLPDAAVKMLDERRKRTMWRRQTDPVFANRHGGWLWPANQRTKLRRVVAEAELETAVTPHTLRRSVGTAVAHQVGQEAARDVLGHSDPSVTFQHYIADRDIAPDVRSVLDQFFQTDDPNDAAAATS